MICLQTSPNQQQAPTYWHILARYLSKEQHSLYGNAFYLILNSVATSLLGFVFWNLVTRSFSPLEVGIGSSLISVSVLLGFLSDLGLGIGLVRFVPQEGAKANRLVNVVFTVVGTIAVVLALLYLMGIGHWSPMLRFISQDYRLLVWFVVFSLGTALSLVTDQALLAGRSARFVFWKNFVICLLKLPLPVLVLRSYGGYGVFAATGAATWVGIMLSWFCFLPQVYPGYYPRPILVGQEVKKMLPFSAGNYLAELLNRTPALIYPLLVLNVCGAEQSAFFYIAWMLAMVLTVIPTGIAQSLFAEGSYAPRKLWLLTKKSLALALVLAIPGALLSMFVSGWFLHLFGPGYLENGLAVVRLLSVAVIPQCLNALFIAVNQVQKRVHLVVSQGAVLAAIALGVGSFLLKRMGLTGIGLGYLVSHLAVAILVIGPLMRAMKKPVVERSERLEIKQDGAV